MQFLKIYSLNKLPQKNIVSALVKLFKKNDKSYAFHLNIHIVNMSQKIKCSLVFLDTDIFHSI